MKVLLIAAALFMLPLTNDTDNVLITYEGETIAIVNRDEFFSEVGQPIFDHKKIQIFTNEIEQLVEKKPVNALIQSSGSIIPEKLGSRLDQASFKVELYTYLLDNHSSKIEVPTLPIYPEVDSELLANIRVKTIGSYVTYFSKRNKSRVNNINLAVNAINSQVIFPGQIFSFNQIVGKRSIQNGYLPGPVIIRGKVYRDIGGGICQVSSTLFNAVDTAGVEILERYSHSKRVPYVPPGRDATVSWYGPDFTFKNVHNQPILIRAHVYGSSVVVTVHSSEVINYGMLGPS